MPRNFKSILVIFCISTVLCFLFIQQNSKIENKLNVGQQFLRQLNQLRTSNSSNSSNANNVNNDTGDSISDVSENLIQRVRESFLFKSEEEIEVNIWIDIPNAFPWRYCIQEYAQLLATLNCDSSSKDQTFKLVPIKNNSEVEGQNHFYWKNKENKCIIPGKVNHEGKEKDSLKVVKDCGEFAGHWIQTAAGQLMWSEGCNKCVQSFKFNTPVQFEFCKELSEDQNFEFGKWNEETKKLAPLDVDSWQKRQETLRKSYLDSERPNVKKAVEEVDIDNLLHEFDKKDPAKRRRAAVFYVDKGKSGINMVHWWLFTWKFIGLNSASQAFDLVMLTHPAAVSKLPDECILVEDSFKIDFTSKGKCLYKPYLGIAYRDKTYDPYMNSQECLYGPGSEFLSQYTLLLRADLDTFPTPRFLNWWPDGIIVDRNYHTNFDLKTIKDALEDLACSAGIQHQGWYNPGSTWYGDARRVRNMAKITVALNKFGRAQMFGPGTACRCSDCDKLPGTCQWGGGPYAGTLLLYLQEIAVNKVMTQAEWDSLPGGLLDQGVVDGARSVCQPALLHCMHNAERFSKLAFGMGSYKHEDMSALDITKVRDYATFMALTSTKQGKNGQEALDRFMEKVKENSDDGEDNDKAWIKFCEKEKSQS